MFINYSNHPSKKWGQKQLECAEKYGPVTDIPFPEISPEWSDREMDQLVEQQVEMLAKYSNATIMVQGESVFSFRLVTALKKRGIPVVAACSKRETTERTMEDGSTVKESVFRFVKFFYY